METKTANELYRESGSNLPFSEWIAQEKEKGYFIKNDSVSSILDEIKEGLDEKPVENKNIFGLSNSVIYISGAIIGLAIIYKIYQTHKNK